MALFWHHVFATGWFKSEHGPALVAQIDLFRENGLGNMRQILLDLSRDPAMIHWIDNSENHAAAIALHFMHYNFCRIHQTLRVTPAMEAGVTDRLWEVGDIVRMIEDAAPKPDRPATYKKRADNGKLSN